MRRECYSVRGSIDALYRPEGRDMTLILPSLWRAYSIGYMDGREARDGEVESLQQLVEDYYMLAFNKDINTLDDLRRLRLRQVQDAPSFADLTEEWRAA